jgi:hypothetical protein
MYPHLTEDKRDYKKALPAVKFREAAALSDIFPR